MPDLYTPSTATLPDGNEVSILLDGDAVNANNLVKQAGGGGGNPNLTLTLLADWITGIWNNGGLTNTASYAGAIWTIGGTTLQTFLRALADKAAKVDVSNTFGAGTTQAFQSFTAAITGTINSLIVSQTMEKAHHSVSAAATAYTYAITDGPVVMLDQWNGGGGSVTVTLPTLATSSSKRYEVEFSFLPTATTHDISFVRAADAISLFTINGPCYAKFRWDGTKWRTMFAAPLTGDWSGDYLGPGTNG